jgi:hypothetical protein
LSFRILVQSISILLILLFWKFLIKFWRHRLRKWACQWTRLFVKVIRPKWTTRFQSTFNINWSCRASG